ncbi:MAG: arsenite efflux transporter metallochaperone ArsD [Balneolaceae bacterium]|nr:arsenite efflux transporter metallochaperone ArsD [Balneolaceae bacterium]
MMTTQTDVKTTLEVYDPAMCCSTGVCGPDVDDSLADFANDIKWLKTQGVEVKRFNLGQEPEAFKMNPQVLSRLQKDGTAVLPLIVVNGQIVSESGYLGREQLTAWTGLDRSTQRSNGGTVEKILSQIEEAVKSGDTVLLRQHFQKGEEAGFSKQQLVGAIQAGVNHRQKVTQNLVQQANELLGVPQNSCAPGSGCC